MCFKGTESKAFFNFEWEWWINWEILSFLFHTWISTQYSLFMFSLPSYPDEKNGLLTGWNTSPWFMKKLKRMRQCASALLFSTICFLDFYFYEALFVFQWPLTTTLSLCQKWNWTIWTNMMKMSSLVTWSSSARIFPKQQIWQMMSWTAQTCQSKSLK